MFLQVRAASRPADSRSLDSRSSSTVSSDAPVSSKPLPPPVAQKPSFTLKTGPADDTTSDHPLNDPASRTFRGKVKAFEQMDHLARAKRMLELQEAELARVCVSSHSHKHTSYCVSDSRNITNTVQKCHISPQNHKKSIDIFWINKMKKIKNVFIYFHYCHDN